MLILIF